MSNFVYLNGPWVIKLIWIKRECDLSCRVVVAAKMVKKQKEKVTQKYENHKSAIKNSQCAHFFIETIFWLVSWCTKKPDCYLSYGAVVPATTVLNRRNICVLNKKLMLVVCRLWMNNVFVNSKKIWIKIWWKKCVNYDKN